MRGGVGNDRAACSLKIDGAIGAECELAGGVGLFATAGGAGEVFVATTVG